MTYSRSDILELLEIQKNRQPSQEENTLSETLLDYSEKYDDKNYNDNYLSYVSLCYKLMNGITSIEDVCKEFSLEEKWNDIYTSTRTKLVEKILEENVVKNFGDKGNSSKLFDLEFLNAHLENKNFYK